MSDRINIKLNELITWVKQEILSAERLKNDPAPLFIIDEVTLEINFTVSGKADGRIELMVAQAGGVVKEERVQKATIHMKSIIPSEELLGELKEKHEKVYRRIYQESVVALLKGYESGTDLDAPTYK